MNEVKIRFCNLQSHENTSFVLKPGMNFILANDNNVGKSTIFKVLSAIAKATNNTPRKLRSLIRGGCKKAYASFEFDNEQVIAWFQQDGTATPKLFFECISENGEIVHTTGAPKSLLDALGIVVDKDGTLINFNDADSVQLIAENSTAADAILTYVILDADVERIKSNLIQFVKDVEYDYSMTNIMLSQTNESLSRLKYNPNVEDYFQNLPTLHALCRVVDYRPNFEYLSKSNSVSNIDTLHHLMTLCQSLHTLLEILNNQASKFPDIPENIKASKSLCKNLSTIDFSIMSVRLNSSTLQRIRVLKNTLSVLSQATHICWRVHDNAIVHKRKILELVRIKSELERSSVKVTCPVKGEVFYDEKECLPVSK